MGPEVMLVNVTSQQREREEGAAQRWIQPRADREVGEGACLGKRWATSYL